MIGIFLLIPLISITGIVDVIQMKIPYYLRLIVFFKEFLKHVSLILILAIYVLLMIGQALFQSKSNDFKWKIQQGFIRHLRDETYKALITSNWGFFLKKRKSDLINSITTELARVSWWNQFVSSIYYLTYFYIHTNWSCILVSAQMTIFVLIIWISA